MSLAQQKAHLRRHPDTRLKLGDKKSRSDQTDPQKPRNAPSDSHMDAAQRDHDLLESGSHTPGPKDHKPDSWWKEQSPEDQQKYLLRYPDSRFAIRHRTMARNLVARSNDKIKETAQKLGSDFHHGMDGIKAWRDGDEMTDDQKEGLKKTATKIGAVLVLSLIAISIFTPLGPAAMEFGESWFRSTGSSLSGDDDEDENNEATAGINLEGHEKEDPGTKASRTADNEQLNWMTNSMTEFLLKQDVAKFAAKISKKSESA